MTEPVFRHAEWRNRLLLHPRDVFLDFRRQVHPTERHEPGTSDENHRVIHDCFDTESETVIRCGPLRDRQLSGLGSPDDGVRHGMGHPPFRCSSQREHLIGCAAVDRHHTQDVGMPRGQGAGFVEDDGIHFRKIFQSPPSLDQNPVPDRFRHGGQYGRGGRDPEFLFRSRRRGQQPRPEDRLPSQLRWRLPQSCRARDRSPT